MKVAMSVDSINQDQLLYVTENSNSVERWFDGVRSFADWSVEP